VTTIGVLFELLTSGSGGVAPAGAGVGARQPVVVARYRGLFCVQFLISVLAMISYTAMALAQLHGSIRQRVYSPLSRVWDFEKQTSLHP